MQRVVMPLVGVLMLWLWLSGGLLAAGPRDRVGPFVLRNGTLIDGTGAAPVANATLVIERNRIVAVGTAGTVAILAHARQMDLLGATMLSGFINTHIHQGYDAQKLQA